MTRTRNAPTKPAPMTRDGVKKMLRDAAFVLRMTRRVKAEVLAERVELTKPVTQSVGEIPAGLGV